MMKVKRTNLSAHSITEELYKMMSGDEFPETSADGTQDRYNEATGTLSCSIANLSEMTKARKYFEKIHKKLSAGSTVEQQMKASYYLIAIEAIKQMEEKTEK